MSDMKPQAESSKSDNTSAPSSAMEDAQIQATLQHLGAIHEATDHSLDNARTLSAPDTSTHLTSPKPDKKPVSFMSLAGELRNRIYRYYLAAQGAALDGHGERCIHPIHPDDIDTICVKDTDTLVSWATPESGKMVDINLLFTCKQAYGEGIGIFFEQRLVQVRMHGFFHPYVARALREALRVELRVDWYNNSPADPRQFLEILEARNDLQEFTFRIGHEDPALRNNVCRIGDLFDEVLNIKASEVSLVWTGAEEVWGSNTGGYHAIIRLNEAIMTRY
ncbi:hypothetical protein EG328_009002 [Venturia inaequalis]|uniref:Uncharacterized protein n=1 Tax=Venturia inaequalis TaxID=5025 RepID=A0A8H3UA71_VENIN|nr:hypothetical protein EG328_009002 [Venturia inaequalis]